MNELLSLEDVYNKKIFRIPDYQRGYACVKQIVEGLNNGSITIKNESCSKI